MNPERWQKVKGILEEALEIAPSSRSSLLEELCSGDKDLRSEVESLLEFEEAEADLLEESAFSIATGTDAEIFIGRHIGRYKIIRELGAGGMGVVFLAERADGEFEQKVALKLIKRGIGSDSILRRFVNERQILASLQHPNIAHLIDGGTTDNAPYFVMEYVEGETILEYARCENLSIEQRLDLFRKICAAVSFAHQKLIIHRDLKPSNILVNTDGVPKLLDFGIAKLLKTEISAQTATQHFAFTPEYASPEQIRGEQLTTATDIYSLGVILYEFLTDSRPFSFENKNFGQIIKTVSQTEPPPPSAVPNSKFQVSDAESQIKRKLLKGDLDNIILKSLRRETERRYSSVEQFSEDIRRHLKGLTVTARQDTIFYRAEKFTRRNPFVVGSIALIFLILMGGIIAVAWQARIANAERAKAERRFNDVRTLANSFIFEVNEKIEESPIRARELLVKRAVEYLDKLAVEAENDATLQAELASAYEKIGDVQAEYFSSGIGDTAGALESHQKALQIRENLTTNAPDNLQFQLDKTNSLLKIADLSVTLGNTPFALENYQKAMTTIETANQKRASDVEIERLLARTYAKFGQGIFRSGSILKSLENYEKAVAIMQKLSSQNPTNSKFRHNLSVYKQYAAFAKMEIGRENEAINLYSEANEIEREIWQNDRENTDNKRNLSVVALGLGINLRRLRRFEESLKYQQKYLEDQQKIYDSDRSNVGDLNSLADAQLEIGWTFSDQGNIPNAVAHLEKAIELYENVVRVDQNNLSAQRQIAFTRLRLGEAVAKTKNFSQAKEIFEKAFRESETVNRKDTKNSEFRHDKAVCLLRIAEITADKKDYAVSNLNQAIEILETLVAESPEHKQRKNDLETA